MGENGQGEKKLTRPAKTHQDKLGDFYVPSSVLWIIALAIPIGALAAVSALVLLRLIALFTNIFYFGRFSLTAIDPGMNHLGWFAVIMPVVGGLIVGFMARYGSERIRGHGIPEAIEVILLNGSRIEPKVAILKPTSAAIAIGSGGPFGAEGPIIVTGGAFGSMIAQMFRLTSSERKTLLVAGAAAGMAATFSAPIASVLLAIELLLFERKPRSIIPVAVACGTAELLRQYLLGAGPVFPAIPHGQLITPLALLCTVFAGIVCGLVSIPLSNSVYFVEDMFGKLPVHWMWWPAIGGLVVGLGGMIFPPALGVGYDNIGALVQGNRTLHLVLGILIVKWIIWASSLGSGTSGGVLAPVMMLGGALGALMSYVMPEMGPGFWAMIGLGGMLSGALRVPMTAIVFTVEETHDWNMLLPLLVGCVASYAVSVMLLRRSILTEKVARRGYHVTSEYAVDPLELLYAREVMTAPTVILDGNKPIGEAIKDLNRDATQNQRLLPVVDQFGLLEGVFQRSHLEKQYKEALDSGQNLTLRETMLATPIVAYADDPLRVVVNRMAEKGVTRMPVVESGNGKFLGVISLDDLLKARSRHLEEEQRRDRTLWLPYFGQPRSTSEKPSSEEVTTER
jgi:chloride channel protein, CIC family